MSMRSLTALLVASIGCSSQAPPPRVLTGRISSAFTIDNPVIIAESGSGSKYITQIALDGSFKLTVPSGQPLRLLLANSTPRKGVFDVVSVLSWTSSSGATDWAQVPATSANRIDLGLVRPISARSTGTSRQSLSTDSTGDQTSHCDNGSSPPPPPPDAPAPPIRDCDTPSDGAQLPYWVGLPRGSTFQLSDAFKNGPKPAEILGVASEPGTWRFNDLEADKPFQVTSSDCDHDGNRGSVGRDRIYVTWKNADGSVDTGHVDLLYCCAAKDAPPPPPADQNNCHDDKVTVGCSGGGQMNKSQCDNPDQMQGQPPVDQPVCSMPDGGSSSSHPDGGTCTDGGTSGGGTPSDAGSSSDAGTTPPPGQTPEGGGCHTDADCVTGCGCFESVCQVIIP